MGNSFAAAPGPRAVLYVGIARDLDPQRLLNSFRAGNSDLQTPPAGLPAGPTGRSVPEPITVSADVVLTLSVTG